MTHAHSNILRQLEANHSELESDNRLTAPRKRWRGM